MPLLKPPRGTQLNKSHPLARGLVGCWLMNEGGGNNLRDISGYNRTLIAGGTPDWVGGNFGYAVNYDGSSEYHEATQSYLPAYPFTLLVWFNSNNVTATQTLIGFADNTVANMYLFLAAAGAISGDPIYFRLQNGTSIVVTQTTKAYSANVWNCAAIVCVKNTLRYIHLNGSNKITGTDTADIPTSLNRTSIGRRATSSPGLYLNGRVSFAAIWKRALTDAEIAWLYREPFAMFEGVSVGKLLAVEVWMAGSAEAHSATSAELKRLYCIVSSAGAQSQGLALCKIKRKVSATAACTAFLSGTLTVSTRLPWFAGSLETERPWLREVLFNCVSANAFKLGTVLTGGWFWVRVSGCSAIYRGAGMEQIDFTNILAIAAQDAREIWPPSYLLHNSNSTYFYVVRRFNNCGYRECTLSAAVEVSIDAGGELAKPQSNNIFCSKTEQMDSNRIRLVWFYCPLEQKSKPARFKIYWDGRTGQIDYASPIATISYYGRKYYNYKTGALDAGRYLFAIRVEDAYGVENDSLARSRIDMHTTAPDPITILSAESI